MTLANVVRALDELRLEYTEVGADVVRMGSELAALEARRDRLGEAIESLERLTEPDKESRGGEDPAATDLVDEFEDSDESFPLLDEHAPDEPLVPDNSPIARYIKRGGKGRRLSSTFMIRDLVDDLDRILTREELKEEFFQRFSRDDMERFWERPDNAFGMALARALKEDLIEQGNDKGVDVYASKEFVRRYNAARAKKRADAEAEEAEE